MHPYRDDCNCFECGFMREVNERLREDYRRDKEDAFRRMYNIPDDPFPEGAWSDAGYKDEEFKVIDRYKVHNPPYNVGRKEGQRKWRRYHDQALDVFNWQYQPWPGHEWVTYFTVTHEALVRAHNLSFAGHKAVLNAHKALSEKRYYKVERIN